MEVANKNNLPRQQRKLIHHKNLQIIFGVSLISFLGISSITPAFPRIVRELGISPQNVGLLIVVFTLPSFLLGPILGILADLWGRKTILVPSLILFGLAGTACAFTRDFNLLLGMRFLQGVGAASLLSLSITLIGDLYSGQELTKALGYQAGIIGIGTAFYPLIGGALALIGWNYPFLLSFTAIPLGFLVGFSFKNFQSESPGNFKEYLVTAGESLRNFRLLGIFFSTLATFVILSGALITYIPIMVEDVFRSSTLTIGLLLSSMFVIMALFSSQFSKLSKVFSKETLIKTSFLIQALALIAIPLVDKFWKILIPIVLIGVALGISLPSIQNLLAQSAPSECRATVIALNGTVLGLGQTIGPLLLGIAFNIGGIDSVFNTAASLAVGTFIIFGRCLDA
jgi:MFS transporter, ACDE family, multidrug resistance protein